MNNNKFHKILSDTITLPLLPASNFKEINTGYYAVLEKNYIPITSEIECIYKPDWITGYKFIKEGENENETNEKLKYYNKLVITSISDNSTGKLRKDVMEFVVRNNVNSLTPINHIYAKVSQIPKEDINVNLEFIPTKQQEGYLNKDGGIISGDEQEIHIKYWATLNGKKQSNVTLTLNTKLLDKDKIKSLKVNSSDNTVELVYLIDENIYIDHKPLEFEAIFKTQYNEVKCSKLIEQRLNTYTITLNIDKQDQVVFNGDNRILEYKCTYKNGINKEPIEVKDNLYLEFSYEENKNELKYSVIKTIYDTKSKTFKTTINVYENYTSEERQLNVKAVYNGSKKIESNSSITLIQDKSDIKLQYYVEYLDRDKNKIEDPSTNGSYNVSVFGETIRLHYYGIIAIDGKNSVKITNVTNTKNNISTTYAIDALVDNVLYNDVTLNGDENILDINFDRNERTTIKKTINFNMNNILGISSALCTLTQEYLSINLELNNNKCTNIIGGIPEYNNIILTFRAYDTTKEITIEDVNLYDITCNNISDDGISLNNIQYEIITYDNINYVVASNIRCKKVYDKKVDRTFTFTVKYNTKSVSLNITQKSAIYDCEIKPDANHVSGFGTDNFKVISKGIIYDGLVFKNAVLDKDNDKKLENPIERISIINDVNNPAKNPRIKNNITYPNKTKSIIAVDALSGGNTINTMKNANFTINIEYKGVTYSCNIKQLYLELYIDLYKNNSYSESAKLNNDNLYISPFINNILYYKCYLCEINMDGLLKKVDLLQYQIKGFSISANGAQFAVQGQVDENPTYNKDYTYTGKITIPKYIISYEVTYSFTYMQGYSNDTNAISNNLYLERTVYINKPLIKTCTTDDSELLNGTYIQYRSNNNKDISYNDNKSILRIGTSTQGISSKGYEVTLYYRVVFKIDLQPDANYIYGNEYKTYIDLDKTHFISFVDTNDITVDKNEFENADEVKFNDSSYLKIKFNVNKNEVLTSRSINKSIKYQFIQDTENHYGAFTNDSNSETNRIEIYQNAASLNLKAFFDDNNSGEITDSSSKITYSAYPHTNQNLHVRVLLNDKLQPTYSNYFKFTSYRSTFQINDGILDSGLNTYKSEYNLDDLYIEPDNKTYTLYYYYNDDVAANRTNDLKVIRTSFGRDDNCELNADINKTEIKNNGDTVKITFYLQYNNGEIIDLGEGAIGNFVYSLNQTSLTPGTNNFIVTYDSELKKYSFDYTIDENLTTEEKTYTFSIQFGGDDERHKKELICIQKESSYELKATISPSRLSPLDAANIKIICSVEKNNNGEIYKGVDLNNFSITQTNEDETKDETGNNRLTLLDQPLEGLLQYQYGKEYKVANNKTKDPITYKFECSYNLNGQILTNDLSTTQSGAKFDVSIFDSETDQSKQNIVNPVGGIKTINYFGILNDEHILNQDKVKFSYEQEGGGVTLIDEVGEVILDTENNVLSRKYKFKLNNTPNTITYKFTVTYQDISKFISFTQKPGDIKLILKNEPSPIPKSGGQCKIIYYGYVGSDPNIKENHITTDFSEPKSTEVDGFMSYTPTKVSGPTVTDYQVEYVFSVPARVEDNNIDKIFKKNWSITYKNGEFEKSLDIDIVQNGDATFFPAFDIFGLKYQWEGGHDLDTVTLLTRSDNGTLLVNKLYNDTEKIDLCTLSMGFSQPIPYIYSNLDKVSYPCLSYINFSGDNTQDCGYESVAVNFRKILLDFQLSKKDINLNFDIWMSWFGGHIWDGKVNIYFETFKGDNITFGMDYLNHIDFNKIPFNPAICNIYKINGTLTNENHSSIMKTTIVKASASSGAAKDFKNNYAKVGQLSYNTKNKTAILTINSIANGAGADSIIYYSTHIKIHVSLKENSYVDHKYALISLYNLILINNVVDDIDNEINIRLEGLYREGKNSNIENFEFTYVNSNIFRIMMYTDPPTVKDRRIEQLDSKYFNNINNNIYNAINKSNNTQLYPSINLNNINQKLPGIDSSTTYYGLSQLYINYNYKYTAPNSAEMTLSISRIIKL